MKLSIQCGQCGKQYQVKPELAGKKVKCQSCGTPIAVPASDAPAAAAAEKKPAAAKSAAGKAPAAAARQAAASPAAAKKAAAPPAAGQMHSLLDEALAGAARLPGAGEMYCPGCKAIIPAASVLCVSCGFDLQAGRQTRVSSEANRRTRKPGQLPALGIVIGILAILYGLPASLSAGFLLVQCVMILVNHGLPTGDDPTAALGMFGFPVALLLLLANMLMFASGIGILRKTKGATPNAALAGKILVGFSVFAMVVVTGLHMWNVQKGPPKDGPDGKKSAELRQYVTPQVFANVLLSSGAGMIIPILVWSWAATQGKRWDWELPEPAYKLKLKPVAKVGGPQAPPEKK